MHVYSGLGAESFEDKSFTATQYHTCMRNLLAPGIPGIKEEAGGRVGGGNLLGGRATRS